MSTYAGTEFFSAVKCIWTRLLWNHACHVMSQQTVCWNKRTGIFAKMSLVHVPWIEHYRMQYKQQQQQQQRSIKLISLSSSNSTSVTLEIQTKTAHKVIHLHLSVAPQQPWPQPSTGRRVFRNPSSTKPQCVGGPTRDVQRSCI